MKITFSKDYTAPTPGHVFRADKFEAAMKTLLREGVISKKDIAAPRPPSRADLLLAHTPAWADKILKFRFDEKDSARLEMKITRAVVRAHLANAGGTLLAARAALKDGVGINCGGGSHHAFRAHGAGFCLVNDIVIAVRMLLKEKLVKRAMVIDLDAHQGDGTASILRGERRVFTFSMHCEDIYPDRKQKSSMDIGLRSGTAENTYLAILRHELPRVLDEFRPEFAVYVAGADVYRGDLLGRLRLTMGGIRKRDAFVLAECRRRGIPVAVTLSGGYAGKFDDTVRIHANTIKEALRA